MPQFNQLKAQFGPSGFEIIGFPCDQFDNQEPGENSEILNTLKYVRPGFGFVPNFLMSQKSDVNGQDEIPLYTFMKTRCPPSQLFLGDTPSMMWDPVFYYDIPWNYEKFLIDKKGQPFKRYNPSTSPINLGQDIGMLLAQ